MTHQEFILQTKELISKLEADNAKSKKAIYIIWVLAALQIVALVIEAYFEH